MSKHIVMIMSPFNSSARLLTFLREIEFDTAVVIILIGHALTWKLRGVIGDYVEEDFEPNIKFKNNFNDF